MSDQTPAVPAEVTPTDVPTTDVAPVEPAAPETPPVGQGQAPAAVLPESGSTPPTTPAAPTGGDGVSSPDAAAGVPELPAPSVLDLIHALGEVVFEGDAYRDFVAAIARREAADATAATDPTAG